MAKPTSAPMPSALPGPPYLQPVAVLGGVPTVSLDVPVTAVFLFLYIICAVCNMTILQLNNRKGHKFIMSGAMFGFCMARISTSIMRIVWATRSNNASIAIAAEVLVAAGVVILYIVNLIFAQRILRASHPNSGWHPAASYFFKAMYALVIISLIMVITVSVISFYTLDQTTLKTAHDIQLYSQAMFTFLAFLPAILVAGVLIFPRKNRPDKFGSGRYRSKLAILTVTSSLLTLGAGFRFGGNAMPERSSSDPAWYQSKACFYIFNFTIEILVLLIMIGMRVDRRFHIPNGARGPGSYTSEKTQLRVVSEEEAFDDAEPSTERTEEQSKEAA